MVLSWAGLAVAWGLSVAGVEEGGGSAFSRPSGFTDASRKKKTLKKFIFLPNSSGNLFTLDVLMCSLCS